MKKTGEIKDIKAQNPYLKRNLKFLRECCELTQQEIADALRIDRSTYTYWERGRTLPSVHKIAALMELYRRKGIKLDYNLLLDSLITASILQEISE